MPNFHKFLVIKENAELAGYFLLLSLPPLPLPPPAEADFCCQV